MSDVVLAEGIYVKQSRGNLGSGATSRECVMESFWFPYKAENGYVELLAVMDNLQRVLGMKERIPVESFLKNYAVKDNSKDIYLELKKTVS